MVSRENEETAFYSAIGLGITCWQYVENSLSEIFAIVSTCRIKATATAIFFSQRDFSDKLAMTHAALKETISDQNIRNDIPIQLEQVAQPSREAVGPGWRRQAGSLSL